MAKRLAHKASKTGVSIMSQMDVLRLQTARHRVYCVLTDAGLDLLRKVDKRNSQNFDGVNLLFSLGDNFNPFGEV